MWYAQTPRRRLGQMILDVTIVTWTLVWVWFGAWVNDLIVGLAQPALRINKAGSGFTTTMLDTAARVRDVPIAGDALEKAFLGMSSTGGDVAGAGWDFAQRIQRLGLALGIATSAAPILLVVVPWLVVRIGFYRRAAAASHFIDADPDLDLFALRALANQPMPKLAAISDDPVGDWRAGDIAVVRRLANLELRSRGLKLPAELARPDPPTTAGI
ncbi:MAG: hypothetical protein Q4P32_09765 [Micrococcales bacterium]|nr:hypothetical protein [Micrococcales bacterium]